MTTPDPTGRGGRGALAALLCLAALPASAQEGFQGRYVTIPGIPSATVAPEGLAFGTLAYTTRRDSRSDQGRFLDSADGSLALGFGLGDASDLVGAQFTINVSSLKDDFGDSGSLGVRLSREVPGALVPTYAALSFDRLAGWGDAEGVDPAASLIVTSFPSLDAPWGTLPLMVTLGVGTHVANARQDPGVFAGVGVGLTRNLGASLAWTGESVTLAGAVRFEAVPSLRLTAGVDDLFDQVDGRRLTLTATFFVQDLFGG